MTKNISYSKMRILAWSLYDFANQPFTTLVITFIYGTFFTKVIADNEIIGTSLWSRAMTITAITVALLSPVMGAYADKSGYRKIFLIFWTYVCVFFTFALYFPIKGQVMLSLIFVILANVGFEMGGVFCNAYLPDLAPKHKIGRISGYGWSLGFVGGLISLAISLLFFIQPDEPIFGLSKIQGENIRATNLLVALWFIFFSIPAFIFLDSDKNYNRNKRSVLNQSIKQIKKTFKEIIVYKHLIRFLIARIFYNDGLVTIFAFGGIYAAGTFDFSFEEIMIFGIVLNVCAGLGAFCLGFLDDVIGGKKTIQISNIGLIIACLIAVFIPNKNLFLLNIPFINHESIITGKTFFWVSGILIGIFSGPNQASSRSMMARLIPRGRENEFFGFYAFTGKATAFVGPMLLGILTEIFKSQRYGVSVVMLMFLIGAIILNFVDEKEGIKYASKSVE